MSAESIISAAQGYAGGVVAEAKAALSAAATAAQSFTLLEFQSLPAGTYRIDPVEANTEIPQYTDEWRDIPDDTLAQELEKKLRIKSLESVEEKPLKSLRNECIKILKKL